MSFSKELLCNPDIILGDLKKTKAYRTLKRIRKEIKEEVQVARDRDPAATSILKFCSYTAVYMPFWHTKYRINCTKNTTILLRG